MCCHMKRLSHEEVLVEDEGRREREVTSEEDVFSLETISWSSFTMSSRWAIASDSRFKWLFKSLRVWLFSSPPKKSDEDEVPVLCDCICFTREISSFKHPLNFVGAFSSWLIFSSCPLKASSSDWIGMHLFLMTSWYDISLRTFALRGMFLLRHSSNFAFVDSTDFSRVKSESHMILILEFCCRTSCSSSLSLSFKDWNPRRGTGMNREGSGLHSFAWFQRKTSSPEGGVARYSSISCLDMNAGGITWMKLFWKTFGSMFFMFCDEMWENSWEACIFLPDEASVTVNDRRHLFPGRSFTESIFTGKLLKIWLFKLFSYERIAAFKLTSDSYLTTIPSLVSSLSSLFSSE